MPVPPFSLLQLLLVQVESERRARDFLTFFGQVNRHEAEGAPRFLLGGPDPQQELITSRTAAWRSLISPKNKTCRCATRPEPTR